MERRTAAVLLAIVWCAFSAACGSLRLPHSDELDEGAPPDDITLPLVERWSYDAGAAFGSNPIALTGHFALVANRRGEVHGIDMRTGNSMGNHEFGEGIDGGPVLLSRTLVVPVKAGADGVQANDVDSGRSIWSAAFEPVEADLARFGSRIVAAGLGGRVAVFESATGDVLWEHAPQRAPYLSAPIVAGQSVIAIDHDGVVRAFDVVSGDVMWSIELSEPVQRNATLVGDVVLIPTTRGRIYALDHADGYHVWTFDSGIGFARMATPVVSEDLVIVAGSYGSVYAIDAVTGTIVWEQDIGAAVTIPVLPFRSGVLVGTMDARLIHISKRTGEMLGEQRVRGRIKSALTSIQDGILVAMEPRHVVRYDWVAP